MATEIQIQSECHQWLWNTYPLTRRLCFHIPNGGLRSKIGATQLQASGVVSGVSDYFIAIPVYPYHGFFIEFKKPGEKVEKGSNQEEFLKKTNMLYYRTAVIDNVEEFKKVVLNYLPEHFKYTSDELEIS